jgi:hypothetical protein
MFRIQLFSSYSIYSLWFVFADSIILNLDSIGQVMFLTSPGAPERDRTRESSQAAA